MTWLVCMNVAQASTTGIRRLRRVGRPGSAPDAQSGGSSLLPSFVGASLARGALSPACIRNTTCRQINKSTLRPRAMPGDVGRGCIELGGIGASLARGALSPTCIRNTTCR